MQNLTILFSDVHENSHEMLWLSQHCQCPKMTQVNILMGVSGRNEIKSSPSIYILWAYLVIRTATPYTFVLLVLINPIRDVWIAVAMRRVFHRDWFVRSVTVWCVGRTEVFWSHCQRATWVVRAITSSWETAAMSASISPMLARRHGRRASIGLMLAHTQINLLSWKGGP